MTKETIFGELLAHHRAKFGISQDELAELSGVSKIQIARYETNKASPRRKAIEKLSNALGITPEDLGCKTLPKSARKILREALLEIFDLKDKYVNTIFIHGSNNDNSEDMTLELKDNTNKDELLDKINEIATNHHISINIKENNNSLSLSIKILNFYLKTETINPH